METILIDQEVASRQRVALDADIADIKRLEDINHMIAHNLRGAASNIKLLSDILLEREKEMLDSGGTGDDMLTMHEALVCIQKSSGALIKTLSTLMDEVENRLNPANNGTECDVHEIINRIAAQMNAVIMQKKAEIHEHLEISKIFYNSAYLESLFYNLISNSLKYARPDVPPVIDIAIRLRDGRPIVFVKDNGMGIDLNKYGNRLFGVSQVFHEGKDSRGVGLYLTRQQIESMGGKIDVESKVNEGTSFTIVL